MERSRGCKWEKDKGEGRFGWHRYAWEEWCREENRVKMDGHGKREGVEDKG